MSRVTKGRIIPVKNTERKFGAEHRYLAVWVEEEDGTGERCVLFTEYEMNRAKLRASRNKEDLTKKGFFTHLME